MRELVADADAVVPHPPMGCVLQNGSMGHKNGSWVILDEVEELIIPQDLEEAFTKLDNSKEYFSSLSKSKKKVLLQWIALAKTDSTRQKRIYEIVENASQEQQPKQFRPKKNGI